MLSNWTHEKGVNLKIKVNSKIKTKGVTNAWINIKANVNRSNAENKQQVEITIIRNKPNESINNRKY